jgi:hypothetical protein
MTIYRIFPVFKIQNEWFCYPNLTFQGKRRTCDMLHWNEVRVKLSMNRNQELVQFVTYKECVI